MRCSFPPAQIPRGLSNSADNDQIVYFTLVSAYSVLRGVQSTQRVLSSIIILCAYFDHDRKINTKCGASPGNVKLRIPIIPELPVVLCSVQPLP